ncbi:MAG TPA: LacI family DNA-binding transcriptional regulator [Rariglobus sp.]
MNTQPTLAEIAAAIGVSVMTVSKVLRGQGCISKTTSERVKAEARRLGYHPNPHGVGLAKARHGEVRRGTLALLVGHRDANPLTANPPHPLHYHYPRMVAGARARAAELGYGLDVFWVYERGVSARRMDAILRARGIDGVVLLSVQPGEIGIDWARYACAYLGRPEREGVAYACADFYSATRMAYLRMYAAGYRRIGLVIDTEHQRLTEGRCLGACASAQPECAGAEWVKPLVCSAGALNRGMLTDWMDRERPDAVLCLRNPVPEWLGESNERGPQVVGWADLDLRTSDGRVAGIRLPHERMGAAGVDLVGAQLQRGERGVVANTAAICLPAEWENGASLSNRTGAGI